MRGGSVRTTQPILKGEELFVSYGNDYWRFHAGAAQSKKALKQRKKRAQPASPDVPVSAAAPPPVAGQPQTARKRNPPHPDPLSAAGLLLTATRSTAKKAPAGPTLLRAVLDASKADQEYSTKLVKPPSGCRDGDAVAMRRGTLDWQCALAAGVRGVNVCRVCSRSD